MLKLKICGMRRPEDIEMANRHKPDYIGFRLVQGWNNRNGSASRR